MSTQQNMTDLERVFQALAESLDRVPAAQRELFLCKAVLLLSDRLQQPDVAIAALASAAAGLAED